MSPEGVRVMKASGLVMSPLLCIPLVYIGKYITLYTIVKRWLTFSGEKCILLSTGEYRCRIGGMTVQIGVRLEEVLLEKIDSLAKKENRTRTNMVDTLLREAIENRDPSWEKK